MNKTPYQNRSAMTRMPLSWSFLQFCAHVEQYEVNTGVFENEKRFRSKVAFVLAGSWVIYINITQFQSICPFHDSLNAIHQDKTSPSEDKSTLAGSRKIPRNSFYPYRKNLVRAGGILFAAARDYSESLFPTLALVRKRIYPKWNCLVGVFFFSSPSPEVFFFFDADKRKCFVILCAYYVRLTRTEGWKNWNKSALDTWATLAYWLFSSRTYGARCLW